MQYRSLFFLIVVFSLCSADLFLFSGKASRPAALTIYNMVLESGPAIDHAAIPGTEFDYAIANNNKNKPGITIAYHGQHANNSQGIDQLAKISK